ncbi:pyridoxamine 5'-phosphate oxidase family protein [Rhodopseudomonas palustris]|uniref:pyridoxamine 5'-phosphate oxidase family protein n=1 Tax=Rhodopseudomonas palustris TaxID=1076 RepID=UPI002ACF0094|nr:pyridoxamine 5'-phosphate oxidase family protein [Rhodopseudomonas palustris]WQG99889.1 pyridoxamine 5'-phosphate oxidase family protein [Rhodopseudomonas palustris]
MNDRICSVADLEAVVGTTPDLMNLKVIDHLDGGALRWLAASPVMFAGFASAGAVAVTIGGGDAGFASGDAHRLRLPKAMLDDPALARPGQGFGSLFLLPGTVEMLRVNGTIAEVRDHEICIDVEQCYGHCGKALLRSEFWTAMPLATAPQDTAGFAAESRLMALVTCDAEGRTDLSPKGDPAGLLRLDEGAAWFADRPGNRRTDSFRNILVQPHVAAALLIPGACSIARLSGRARITSDAVMRAAFAVDGKAPKLVTVIDDLTIELHDSPALRRARLWPLQPQTHGIEAAKLFVEHIKLNRNAGFGARLASAALSVPGVSGLLKKGLDKEYKDNLY